jgi:hypothetical protein
LSGTSLLLNATTTSCVLRIGTLPREFEACPRIRNLLRLMLTMFAWREFEHRDGARRLSPRLRRRLPKTKFEVEIVDSLYRIGYTPRADPWSANDRRFPRVTPKRRKCVCRICTFTLRDRGEAPSASTLGAIG